LHTKETPADAAWARVKKYHRWAAWAHAILLAFCVYVAIKTSDQTPSLGKVKTFDAWPIWDDDSPRAQESRVPIFENWNHCQRADVSASGKRQCNKTVRELEISLVMILIVTQTCTFLCHFIQYKLCTSGSPTFKALSERGIKLVFWIEYTFSASFIAVVTSFLSGNVDIKSLLLILASQSTLMLVGLLIDILRHLKDVIDKNVDLAFREMLGTDLSLLLHPQYYDDDVPFTRSMVSVCCSVDSYTALMLFIFVVGFFNLGCQWMPGLVKVIDSIDTDMPTWIVGLYLTEFVLYSSFGVVQFYYTLWKRNRAYMLDEHNVHTFLSFASKFTLVLFFIMYFVRESDNRGGGGGANSTTAAFI